MAAKATLPLLEKDVGASFDKPSAMASKWPGAAASGMVQSATSVVMVAVG